MLRLHRYPELLFIVLVMIAPFPFAILWNSTSLGFFARLLLGMAAGLAVWLAVIFLIVWPRYRN